MLSQLLHAIQPIDVTVNPLPSIPLPQLVTLVASNAINIGDIKIEIQSIGLMGKLIVRVVQVLYLISGNLYIALGKLQEELQAYTELNINSPPKKNIYISLQRHKNLAIWLEGTLIIALSKIVKNGIKKAVLIALFSPSSLNS